MPLMFFTPAHIHTHTDTHTDTHTHTHTHTHDNNNIYVHNSHSFVTLRKEEDKNTVVLQLYYKYCVLLQAPLNRRFH